MKKIKNLCFLPVLIAASLVASCSTNAPTRAELVEKGKAITDTFTAPTTTKWSSTIEGHLLDLWDSNKDPVSENGDLGYIDSDSDNFVSTLFGIPTMINSEKFEATYSGSNKSLVYNIAPTTSTVSNELGIEKSENGGIVFTVENENMELYIYGLKNSEITNPDRPSRCKARWNIEVEYNNQGCMVSEKAWITATHNTSSAYTADLVVNYTLS